MQVDLRFKAVSRHARKGVRAAFCCGLLISSAASAAPAGDPPGTIDIHLVAELEQRAGAANPREQAFLYADLADKMTMLASHQIAEGEIEKAEDTLQKLEACTAKMESNFKQSKSLKKTELLLHTTNRRLTDMARAASFDVKPHIQQALLRLNAAQTSLLAVLFEQ